MLFFHVSTYLCNKKEGGNLVCGVAGMVTLNTRINKTTKTQYSYMFYSKASVYIHTEKAPIMWNIKSKYNVVV